MRVNELDIVLVAGLGGSGPQHWQTRWQARLSTAHFLAVPDWDVPHRADWTNALEQTVKRAARPVVLVAHSLGAVLAAHAIPALPKEKVAAAFLVAPPDLDDPAVDLPVAREFAPMPKAKLGIPAVLVASRTDHFCRWDRAIEIADQWGAEFVDAGDAGHINTASGHGPWPEGLMRFAGLTNALK